MLLSDIREGSGALFCLTNRTECCSQEAGGERGLWRLPDGTLANETTSPYRIRGFSSLFLNNRMSNTVSLPIGIYSCVIPDDEDIIRTLYIGVYSIEGM